MSKIKINTTINSTVKNVWELYTDPTHIVLWNNASDDWHTTKSENDLRVGGKFLSRMEAKDGSQGFDFIGTYNTVDLYKLIQYTMSDGRKVDVKFIDNDDTVDIEIVFDAEETNSLEMQKTGWQAILDNFKSYVENRINE